MILIEFAFLILSGINSDRVMTLTYFKAMTTKVAYINAFEWCKLLKSCQREKSRRIWAMGLNIYDREKMTLGVRLPPPWGNIDMLIKHLPLQKRMANPGDKAHNITKTCPCNIQRFFSAVKIENFIGKKINIFLIFAQNIDCGYTLEPPR